MTILNKITSIALFVVAFLIININLDMRFNTWYGMVYGYWPVLYIIATIICGAIGFIRRIVILMVTMGLMVVGFLSRAIYYPLWTIIDVAVVVSCIYVWIRCVRDEI